MTLELSRSYSDGRTISSRTSDVIDLSKYMFHKGGGELRYRPVPGMKAPALGLPEILLRRDLHNEGPVVKA